MSTAGPVDILGRGVICSGRYAGMGPMAYSSDVLSFFRAISTCRLVFFEEPVETNQSVLYPAGSVSIPYTRGVDRNDRYAGM